MVSRRDVLTAMTKVVGGLLKSRPDAAAKPSLAKSDFAALQIALMVAALDGSIQASEYKAFSQLARKCQGYTPELAESTLDAALRRAGYLLLQAQRLPRKALVAAFCDEVKELLPAKFAVRQPEDARRAFVMWTAMAMADGDYSGVEKDCLLAVFALLRADVVAKCTDEMNAAREKSPVYVSEREMKEGIARKAEAILPVDFPARAERIVKVLADFGAEKSAEVCALVKGA